MHRPKVVNDKLIFLASSKFLPYAPVLAILSLPAKSTRFSLAYLIDPSGFFYKYSIMNIV
jgi:hypothetical protein